MSAVRYYKYRGLPDPVVYVQDEEGWQIYADGILMRRSTGRIPPPMLAQTEEITQVQAEELIEAGQATAKRIEAERAEANREQAEPTTNRDEVPSGLGGWLVLPILALGVTLLRSVVWMSTDIVTLLGQDGWSAMTTSGTDVYSPWFGPTVIFEVLMHALMIVVPVALFVFLFQKRWFLPRLMVGYYIVLFLLVLVDSVIVLTHGADMLDDVGVRAQVGWSSRSAVAEFSTSLLGGAIWISYFSLSQRVKNTFVR